MIISFKDQATEDIFNGISSKKALKFPVVVWQVGSRKLDMINAAHELKDLMIPPGNRLEALKGDLKGYHSIRINEKYRIVFKWLEANASEVEIKDYH